MLRPSDKGRSCRLTTINTHAYHASLTKRVLRGTTLMTTAFAARHSCAQYRALPYAATQVRRIHSKVIFTCFTSSGLAPYPGSLNLRRKLLSFSSR